MPMQKKKNQNEFQCPKCGQIHDRLPALGFATPFHYDILSDQDKNEIAEISEDFCIINHPEQTDRFIRAVMTLQVNDACEDLDYEIWVSLSEKSFDDYKSTFKSEAEEKIYFGTICNKIPDYEESTIGLHVDVKTCKGGIRPEIIPHQTEHQLIKDWEKGISIDEAERRVTQAMKNNG